MPSCRATPGPPRVCVSTNSVLTARAFHGPAGQPLPSELPEGSGTLFGGTSLMPGCSARPAIPTSTKIHSTTPISSRRHNNDGQARLRNPRRRGSLGGTTRYLAIVPQMLRPRTAGKRVAERTRRARRGQEQARLPQQPATLAHSTVFRHESKASGPEEAHTVVLDPLRL